MDIKELLSYLKPDHLIKEAGPYALWVVMAIIYSETGLLIGFFLPGDSLLFVCGLFVGTGDIPYNIILTILILTVAAILGNLTGYYFGKSVGPKLFAREDSLIFKKKYLEATQAFYTKNGGRALILGRFIPIIRTFVPILAGAIKMDFSKFMLYNIIGALLWVPSLTIAGYYLGRFTWVKENVEIIVIGLVIITIIPVVRTFLKEKKNKEVV
ncbi:MAG: VTT domain-containing protein [Bacteroidota bacterium]|nr:VTT domain-containing protein [Bacteroidota bacterium]